MSYQVFARKWRPQNFDEVVGQIPVARTLLNAIEKNRLGHAYLFSGARGVGKTSMARLLAKAVNCENGPTTHPCGSCSLCREISSGTSVDVLEIDGASNRGIDNIRELKDQVKYAPLKGRFKIYIIDEVHMLTSEAFNALLKTLEEPPASTLFIMATTELHKIPSTILSRCQQFHFKKIARLEIINQLKKIIREEKVQISEKGLLTLSKAANGSLRDALSLLDQIVAFSGTEVDDGDILSVLGAVDTGVFYALTEAIAQGRSADILGLLAGLFNSGCDVRFFCQEWIGHLRGLLMLKIMPQPESIMDLPDEEISDLSRLARLFSEEQIQRLFRIFTKAEEEIRFSSQPLLILEVAFVQSASLKPLEPIQELVRRIELLSKKLDGLPDEPAIAPPPAEIPARLRSGADPLPLQAAIVVPPEPDSMQKLWSRLMSVLKEKGPHLESYLKESQWIQEEGDRLKIGYPRSSPFLNLLRKEENLNRIAEEAGVLLGRPLSVKIVEVGESDAPAVRGEAIVPKRPEAAALIQKIEETLAGKVIAIRDITP